MRGQKIKLKALFANSNSRGDSVCVVRSARNISNSDSRNTKIHKRSSAEITEQHRGPLDLYFCKILILQYFK